MTGLPSAAHAPTSAPALGRRQRLTRRRRLSFLRSLRRPLGGAVRAVGLLDPRHRERRWAPLHLHDAAPGTSDTGEPFLIHEGQRYVMEEGPSARGCPGSIHGAELDALEKL